ncbi:MAG: response regulator [Deltaproteobacteria bacterium]|nr:response regulator [Deltaproteobacteria bacterium]
MQNNNKLLVIDDEQIVCDCCDRVLTPMGYHLDVCTNPVDALRRTNQNRYDAVLLDMKMEEMSGLDFLKAFRKHNADTPVIVITGYPTVENVVSAMRLGIADYIQKPFKPSELLKGVKRAMSSQNTATILDDEPNVETPPTTHDAILHTTPLDTLPEIEHEGLLIKKHNIFFYNHAWLMDPEEDYVFTGTLLPGNIQDNLLRITLPAAGDFVSRGQIMASVFHHPEGNFKIQSPISGKIMYVNNDIIRNPDWLWEEPFSKGWLAVIDPFFKQMDINVCKERHVILATHNYGKAKEQYRTLNKLGLCVHVVTSPHEALQEIKKITPRHDMLTIIDDTYYIDLGEMTGHEIHYKYPGIKIVVLGDDEAAVKAKYGAHVSFSHKSVGTSQLKISTVLYSAFQDDGDDAPLLPRKYPVQDILHPV